MATVLRIVLTLIGCLAAATEAIALPAFPGARGFGSETVGGSGRQYSPAHTLVFRVTSLATDGPNTLRACVNQSGPRVCVFETSGTIELHKALRIGKPFITIAGQTAPAPGILIRGAGISVDTHDVVIQHLQIRPGDSHEGQNPDSRDGVQVAGEGSYNVVVDHVSVSWATDEGISTGQHDVHDVTYSNCLVAESLWNSVHPKGPHSMGVLIGDGSKNITIRDSLFAHNVERNPRLKPDVRVEFINNLVYHWGGRYGWNLANLSDTESTGKESKLYFVGNYYKLGPHSPSAGVVFAKPYAKQTKVYVGRNIGPLRTADEGDPWSIGDVPAANRASEPPFALSQSPVRTPDETYAYVLHHAGARPAERNKVDRRIIEEVQKGTGQFKDCVSGCSATAGGWPAMATNRRPFVLPERPFEIDPSSGYTRLEQVLQRAAEEVESGR